MSVFAAAFMAAKERIRKMEYRYVEEADQNRQALLEIYCAVGPTTISARTDMQANATRASAVAFHKTITLPCES